MAASNSAQQYQQLTDPFNQYNDPQTQSGQSNPAYWNLQTKTPLSQVLYAAQFLAPYQPVPPLAATGPIYTTQAYTELREVLCSIPAGLTGAVIFFIAPANGTPSDYVAFNFQFDGMGIAGVPQFQQLSFQTGLEPNASIYIGVIGADLVSTIGSPVPINYRLSGVVVSR